MSGCCSTSSGTPAPGPGPGGPELDARRRLDAALVERGLAANRAEAGSLVTAGRVLVGGAVAEKPARRVGASEPLVVTGPPARFASRGGDKLDGALDAFGVEVAGARALDAGASTGGFTDCLLQRGAARVVAVDVGRGQMLARLRADQRVELHERTNVRELVPGVLGGRRFELVVADLSFISLRTVAAALVGMCLPGGDLVVLVKPQFEAGRPAVSRGKGVVRDAAVWYRVLAEVTAAFAGAGAGYAGAALARPPGARGNTEFFLHLRALAAAGAGGPGHVLGPGPEAELAEVVARAVQCADGESRSA